MGGLGVPLGADICLANNAIEFRNHPLMFRAVTLGNTISYSKKYTPKTLLLNATVAEHEKQHTYQGELLGPLYLPSNLLGLTLGAITGDTHGSINWNERGPQASPPTPW